MKPRGLSTRAASLCELEYTRPPSLILPTPLERIPRHVPLMATTMTMEVVAAATGNGSSPAAWKRRARRRDRALSIYKQRYAHRNVTTFQHSVFGAPLPLYSLSARYLSDKSSHTTAAFTHPRDHCSPRYGFDSATGKCIV